MKFTEYIYRALDNFYCSRNTIKKEKDKLRLIAREEVEKFLVKRVVNDQRNFIQIDTTPNSKKHSAKAIDRMYIRVIIAKIKLYTTILGELQEGIGVVVSNICAAHVLMYA